MSNPKQDKSLEMRTLNKALERERADRQRILALFRAHGQTISSWALEQGFSAKLVYAVLSGRKCVRGESHRIALALHLKLRPEES